MPDDTQPPARRLTPKRLAELKAASTAAEQELARVQAVCTHPGDKRQQMTWGAVCGLCKARLA